MSDFIIERIPPERDSLRKSIARQIINILSENNLTVDEAEDMLVYARKQIEQQAIQSPSF